MHFYQFTSGSRRLPKELIVDEIDGTYENAEVYSTQCFLIAEMFLPSHQGILIQLKKNIDVSTLPGIFRPVRNFADFQSAALLSD